MCSNWRSFHDHCVGNFDQLPTLHASHIVAFEGSVLIGAVGQWFELNSLRVRSDVVCETQDDRPSFALAFGEHPHAVDSAGHVGMYRSEKGHAGYGETFFSHVEVDANPLSFTVKGSAGGVVDGYSLRMAPQEGSQNEEKQQEKFFHKARN